MIKFSLFAKRERQTKLDRIGDALGKLGEHGDVAGRPRRLTRQRRDPVGSVGDVPRLRRGGWCVG